MSTAILGRKIGMTRLYDADGNNVPVTVVQAGPCFVAQVKTAESDGYDAVQLAFEDIKPRSSTYPLIGHDTKAGIAPKRFRRELRLGDGAATDYQPGQEITVEAFADVKFCDVIGTSKGKGFQGPMKRHGFAGQEASHGVERKHRSPGSIGGRSSNLGTGKPKKGIRMGGHMGAEQVTVRSLKLMGIDREKNLLLIQGPVPGPKQGLLYVRKATRLYKGKAKTAQAG